MGIAAIDLVQREISNPDTQWSLGTFGAKPALTWPKTTTRPFIMMLIWQESEPFSIENNVLCSPIRGKPATDRSTISVVISEV